MKKVRVSGDIVTDDIAPAYKWMKIPYTSPSSVRDVMDTLDPDEELLVEINSSGGLVTAGMEIYSMLRDYRHTTIEVTGIAASAASVIAMAGHVRMQPIAMLMIHNVQGNCSGDYHAMKKTAGVLQDVGDSIAAAYADKSGRPVDEMVALMDNETWIGASRAIELGLADEIVSRADETTNAVSGLSVTQADIDAAMAAISAAERENAEAEENARQRALRKKKLLLSLSLY